LISFSRRRSVYPRITRIEHEFHELFYEFLINIHENLLTNLLCVLAPLRENFLNRVDSIISIIILTHATS
ncbi:MAG: hypothetical protein V3U02_01665, partial [Calditrichia bacterium]